MIKLNRIVLATICCLLSSVVLYNFALSKYVQAASQTQAYHSSSSLVLGTVVATTSAGSNNLESANLDNEKFMVGVVINSQDSVVDLQPNGSNLTVANNGQVSLLVTDLTGDIKSGDNLVVSPVGGVATKDTSDSTAKKYVAIASESFNGNSATAHSVSVDYDDGGTKQVSVGLIHAKLNLIERPPNDNSQNQNFIVAFISKLIGKPVNKTKLIAATVILITTLLISGVLLQGSIRGSFVALGRNPLSKPIILSNLFRVIAISILILEVGIVIGYVILVV